MRRIVVLATAGVVLLLLVLAQLFLPSIAENRIKDKLKGSGQVVEVNVSAFPAIKLLWHDADKVTVRMASYRSGTARLNSLLDQSADVGTLDASADVLTAGLLTIHDARLHKSGNTLTGVATVKEADLIHSVPILQSVTPVASGDGQLTLRGTASLFGLTATIDATVSPQNGRIVAVPDVPFGGFAGITVFNNPHVDVQSISARPIPGGFTVTVRATLK